ncbi:hypothetical protein [Natronomonas sp.]|uniref:hypothetical protein n=1 Tax=Natronomonas sp. TaxID=2184060 RepID=UPI002FC39102
MSDADRLYEHLAATAELPVERSASRLLGEAEAVADDLREAAPDVQTQRAAVVVQLLAKVEGTGNSEADEHVERARALAAELADE